MGQILGLGTTLVISSQEIEDIIKIANSLKESGLLKKVTSKTIKNETIEQKGLFLGILFGTLGAML